MANTINLDDQVFRKAHEHNTRPPMSFRKFLAGVALTGVVIGGANIYTGHFSGGSIDQGGQPDLVTHTFVVGPRGSETGTIDGIIGQSFKGEEDSVNTADFRHRILEQNGIEDIGSLQPGQRLQLDLTPSEIAILESNQQQQEQNNG